MKAAVNKEYGSPDVVHIADVPKPEPKDNEVLIKVHATTVNRTDTGFRSSEYFIIRLFFGLFKPKRHILGSELAGEVVAIGKDVTSFKVGDNVFGLHTDIFGAHAEYIAVPESGSITTMPGGASYAEAVAICEGPWLALTFLKAVKIGKGHRAVLNGASGSIGSSALQLAKYFGAEVTAVIGTKNVELAHSLGADRVIDYMKEDFTTILEEGAYDFVFDAVGKSTFGKCKKLLKPGGIYISSELGPHNENPFLALWTPFFSKKKVKFPIPKDKKEHIIFFKELYEAGKLRAVIDRHYPLDEIVEAHRYAESGQKTGSVVIDVV